MTTHSKLTNLISISRRLVALAAILALFSSTAHAASFYPITSVTSDTAGTDFFPAVRLIEGAGVGFDAAEPHNRTSTLTWVTNAPNGGTGDYFGPTPNPSPRLVFDLGADVLLGEISVWGYADTNGNGATDIDLRFATAADGLGGFGTSIAYNPSFSGITQPVTPRQSFAFNQLLTARYVELTPTDNLFGVAPPGGDRVGLGEVAFEVQQAPTPEPSTFILAAIGLLGLGLTRRRRGRSVNQQHVAKCVIMVATAIGTAWSFADTASAAQLLTPTGITNDVGSEFFPAPNLINDSGLSAVPDINTYPGVTHAGSGAGNAWVTNAFFPDYYTGGGPVPVQTFDLGGLFDLTDVVGWQYSVPGNAARQITATFSTTGTGGPFGSPTVFEMPQAAGPAHTVSLGGTFSANAVRFTYDTNWDGFGAGGDRVGLGEVKFIGDEPASATPEPSTAILAVLGLLGLGLTRRRRRR